MGKIGAGGGGLLTRTNLLCTAALVIAVFVAAYLYPGLGGLTIWSTMIALGVGVVFWGGLALAKSQYKMTFVEATVASVVLLVAVIPLTAYAGTKLAVSSQLTYHEFENGFELKVDSEPFYCHESEEEGSGTGGCINTYDGDSYITYHTEQQCTGSGKDEECTEVQVPETHYRQIPYTTTETTWVVHTTVGDINVGDHWLPANPQQHRVDPEFDFMDGLPNLPSGTPADWLAAQRRLASGNHGPASVEHDYANYILASQDETLKAYSSDIDRYKNEKLLPDLNHELTDGYLLNRFYSVGTTVLNENQWQDQLSRYDAALGSDLQGDMYLVIVDSNKVSNPDSYIRALTAYWESPAFGSWALSKNGIVVVLGTKDGKLIDWARASTGMPTGNHTMVDSIATDLHGTALTPAAVLGRPTPSISEVDGKTKVAINHTQPAPGALESHMWGENGFKRTCMVCDGPGETGVGFSYLKSQIQPTSMQVFGILSVLFIASCAVWGATIYFAVPLSRSMSGGASFRSSNPLAGFSFSRRRR